MRNSSPLIRSNTEMITHIVIVSLLGLVFAPPSSLVLSFEFSDFHILNKTCARTWPLLEATLNLTRITRIDFLHSNCN